MPAVKPPRSQVAKGFYILGALMTAFASYEVISMYLESGMISFLFQALPPILVILFGSVVQMVFDIRWHLSMRMGDTDA